MAGTTRETVTRELKQLEQQGYIFTRGRDIIKTEGNFNNLIGLPLTLLKATSRHRAAVLEAGMNQPGELARLAQISLPNISIINNIQEAHLEGLGSIDGVADVGDACRDPEEAKRALLRSG